VFRRIVTAVSGGSDPARVSFPAATAAAAVLSAVRLVFVAQRHLLCL